MTLRARTPMNTLMRMLRGGNIVSWPKGLLLAIFLLPGSAYCDGLPSKLYGATAWLNTSSGSAPDLQGKVVIVQFWTYTCVNWRRTLPYIRAWSAKYRDQDLIVVGVHTPEFDFEENIDNVRTALAGMGIDYPIAVDSRHSIWNAFHNVYWPAFYLIDPQGRIRYSHFGEGEYQRSEREIQKLLAELGHRPAAELSTPMAQGQELSADIANLRSPETYVGYEMAQGFASKEALDGNRPRQYSIPKHLSVNAWALSGMWTVGGQRAVLNEPGGKVFFRFHARDMNLIMGPAVRSAPARIRVLIDGQPPGSAHGEDIDERGYGSIDSTKMYQLIRQIGRIEDHTASVEFLDAGIGVYDFTFG
jgi:thiol-disulfide isomerase/thioredoxin